MVARELISGLIPPLKTSDTADKALIWMAEFNVSHLPIVNNEQFLGLIGEEDILDLSQPDEPIGNHQLSLQRPFVHADAHLFEVIKSAAEMHLSLIPVVDADDKYVGTITLDRIIQFFAENSSLSDPGGIIVLEMNKTEYAMSEIARIAESGNANILASFVASHRDSTKIEVTLKLNVTDIASVIATFERFEYTVKATYQETEHTDQLKDRYDSLMNYLNV